MQSGSGVSPLDLKISPRRFTTHGTWHEGAKENKNRWPQKGAQRAKVEQTRRPAACDGTYGA